MINHKKFKILVQYTCNRTWFELQCRCTEVLSQQAVGELVIQGGGVHDADLQLLLNLSLPVFSLQTRPYLDSINLTSTWWHIILFIIFYNCYNRVMSVLKQVHVHVYWQGNSNLWDRLLRTYLLSLILQIKFLADKD